MNIEQALKNYKQKVSVVEAIEARIKAYEDMLQNTSSNKFELNAAYVEVGMPKGAGGTGSPTEGAVVSLECTREKVKELIAEEKSRLFFPKLEVEQIESALKALTTWEKYIIECKFFDGRNWRNIELSFNAEFKQKNDLTEARIRQISGDAIVKLAKILEPFYSQYEVIFEISESVQKAAREIRVSYSSPVKVYKLEN